MTLITSVHNPRVKDAARLRDGRHRRKEKRILIEGVRELARAIASGITLHEIFVCESLLQDNASQALLAMLPGCGAERIDVSEQVFERLAFGDRAEGVIGVAARPTKRLDDLVLPANPIVGLLEGIEKPGNLGAVLRSADGAGLSALLAADAGTDLYNPAAIRASLGTIFGMNVCETTSREALDWMRVRKLQIFAARVEGSVCYTEVDFRGPTAIVLGSEANGLDPFWAADDVTAIRLPMLGVADSLNVSAAAAVLFYEARRQRGVEV